MRRSHLLKLAGASLTLLAAGTPPVWAQAPPSPTYGMLQVRTTANRQPVKALVMAFRPDGNHIGGFSHTDQRNPGVFTHNRVQTGLYEVEVWAPGLRPLRIYGVKVEADKPATVNASLTSGPELQEIGEAVAGEEDLQLGSLEGFVLSPTDTPALKVVLKGARRPDALAKGRSEKYLTISVTPQGGHSGRAGGSQSSAPGPITFTADLTYYMGGNYKLRGLTPGTYDLEMSGSPGEQAKRITGVIIKSGHRTVLSAKFQPGAGTQEVRMPAVTYIPVKPLNPPMPKPAEPATPAPAT